MPGVVDQCAWPTEFLLPELVPETNLVHLCMPPPSKQVTPLIECLFSNYRGNLEIGPDLERVMNSQ